MLPALLAVLAVAPLDVAGCKAAKTETGSIHAATSFEVTMTKPKSKLKQPLDCGGSPVTLYLQEFASEKVAGEAANMTGPMLWGENAPHDEENDELLLKGPLLVVISGPAVAAATAKLTAAGFKPWRGGEDAKADAIDRLSKELDCSAASKDPLRAWCPVAQTKTAAFAAPKGKGVYLGISAPFPSSKSVHEGLQATRMSVLAYDGDSLWLSDVKPENDGEAKQIAEVVAGIALVLKADVKGLVVPKDLAGYLDTLPAQAKAKGAPAKDSMKGPAAVAFKSPSRVWKVKWRALDCYVISEDGAGGQWLSVYPVVPIAPK